MCGISGFISSSQPVQATVERMNFSQQHRGPDSHGIFVDGAIGLGHQRLSILDLSDAGAQPMRFGPWVVVFNGEIYNFMGLRSTLESKGYNFESRSDTEVLLKAWDCFGPECLTKFEGMFAFALYDTRSHELHLCRDSYGVKPLFYRVNSDSFIFASELNALRQGHGSPFLVDRDAVATFLALHYVPAPQTGCLNVFKLAPGYRICVTNCQGSPKVSEPIKWAERFAPQLGQRPVSLKQINDALAHSVQQQMISDVPVGAFLSGGVDSSLICHYASKVHPESLHTFSIGFSDAGPEYDESVYAAKAAAIIGAQHHAVTVELAGLSDSIDSILMSLGELNADTSVFLNYFVCEEARKYVTVGLSGAGGDEMFGGYFRYQGLLAMDYLNLVPSQLVKMVIHFLNLLPQNRDSRTGNLVRRVLRFLELKGKKEGFLDLLRQDRLFPQNSSFLANESGHSLEAAMAYDFSHFLGDNIFSFSDKMSMLHGLEVRVPFLDPGVIKVAEELHRNQRVTLWEKKVALKRLAVQYFPKELIYRKKQGFAAPVEVWLRQLSKEELRRRCLDGVGSGFVDERAVEQVIDKFIEERKDYSLQLYALIVLNVWYNNICG